MSGKIMVTIDGRKSEATSSLKTIYGPYAEGSEHGILGEQGRICTS